MLLRIYASLRNKGVTDSPLYDLNCQYQSFTDEEGAQDFGKNTTLAQPCLERPRQPRSVPCVQPALQLRAGGCVPQSTVKKLSKALNRLVIVGMAVPLMLNLNLSILLFGTSDLNLAALKCMQAHPITLQSQQYPSAAWN